MPAGDGRWPPPDTPNGLLPGPRAGGRGALPPGPGRPAGAPDRDGPDPGEPDPGWVEWLPDGRAWWEPPGSPERWALPQPGRRDDAAARAGRSSGTWARRRQRRGSRRAR